MHAQDTLAPRPSLLTRRSDRHYKERRESVDVRVTAYLMNIVPGMSDVKQILYQ